MVSSSAALAVQHADARRAEHLVARECVEVAIERAARRRANAARPALRRRARWRRRRGPWRRAPRPGSRCRARSRRGASATIFVRGRAARRNASTSSAPSSVIGATTSRAPVAPQSSCHGTMFEWCSSHVINTSSPGLSRWPKLAATRLMRLRRTASEDDLLASRGVDEAADLLARAFVRRGRALAELVHAAMDVRVIHALLVAPSASCTERGRCPDAALSR